MPAILFIFNGLLSLVSLLNMYRAVAQVKIQAVIQYSGFLQLYAFVAALEFLLLMFIMPALTSGSISGERERQTLELLFTTKMSPADIVTGKLMSAFTQMMVLVVSSLPVILVTFVYGSVNFIDLGLMFCCYVTVAFMTGGLGILFSSMMRRSTFSNVWTYGVLLFLVVGSFMLNQFLLNMSAMEISNMVLPAGEIRPTANSGAAVYLLLLNPAVTFVEILGNQVPAAAEMFSVSAFWGARPETFLSAHWIPISIAVQAAVSALFVAGAVYFLSPVKNEKK